MLDLAPLAPLARSLGHRPVFVTVSGAHLYGFPSADSDIDLRGAHLLPLEKIVGLQRAHETIEKNLDHHGVEVELVSHDLGKYLRLLVKNNGYVLEQIFSPLVVLGQEFLDRLRPVAAGCITRNLYHHYRGFLQTQLKLLEKEDPKKVKTLLYAYRVLLTGIHVLRTGTVEANIQRLNESHRLDFIDELIAHKKSAERVRADRLDWTFHRQKLAEIEAELEDAFKESTLAERPSLQSVHDLLVAERLAAR